MKPWYPATLTRGTATPRCVLVAHERPQHQKGITLKALPPDAAAPVLETRATLILAGIPDKHVDAILANFIPSKSSVATKQDIKELKEELKEEVKELRLYLFLLMAGMLLSVTPESPLGTITAGLWKVVKP
ncbi:hypothetical protein CHLRE_12g499204v5 [Chlamydomonas reinhardtii]|uniref:Uncharacterized protein n=1 Tax=Chlamydomonas reinhardtii TaxID=3055 RepID=A8JGI4_CHLRE|nr:uncharacterized protein CHLRE_12g499204v5 [Chlamydomonas reinhardtii]PNW75039.1 hypothetical protein CHLRE_12g499204v5 [Chlamydomonas reinhardtii]|eukprot:XP_001702376.1 predicted protein [Chlamydomonas reinhardtii]